MEVGPGVWIVLSIVSVKDIRSVVVVGTSEVRIVVLQDVYVVPGSVIVVEYQEVMKEVSQVEYVVVLTETSVVLYVLTSVVRTVGPGIEISFVCVTSLVISFVGPGVSFVTVVVKYWVDV